MSVKRVVAAPCAKPVTKASRSPFAWWTESSVNIVIEIGIAKIEKGSTYQTRE